jgi:mRNA-degrading endonuclease RelE of RelBE toxin-antitoxin system
MLTVTYGEHFIKSAARLPRPKQVKLAGLLEILKINPFDSRLHTKHLSGKLSGLYSFRITRDWRVIFQFLSTQAVHLIDVANRKDIYR